MRRRLRTKRDHAIYPQRKITVEPVFGQMKGRSGLESCATADDTVVSITVRARTVAVRRVGAFIAAPRADTSTTLCFLAADHEEESAFSTSSQEHSRLDQEVVKRRARWIPLEQVFSG